MTVTAGRFVGHYTLETCNGETLPTAVKVDISAVEGKSDTIAFVASVANTMRGHLTVSAGNSDDAATLKGMLMSTRMMGPPFLMTVERVLSQGTSQGCEIKLKGDTLTLTSGEDKLVFKRS